MTSEKNLTPYQTVEQTIRSQGGRKPKAQIEALTEHLMNGGKPETLMERMCQISLMREGYLDKAGKPTIASLKAELRAALNRPSIKNPDDK